MISTDDAYVQADLAFTSPISRNPARGTGPGQKVHIAVDAMGGEGSVPSLAPASGAAFSMLPPENALGNFTKVAQRVPVRIDLPRWRQDHTRLPSGSYKTVTAPFS